MISIRTGQGDPLAARRGFRLALGVALILHALVVVVLVSLSRHLTLSSSITRPGAAISAASAAAYRAGPPPANGGRCSPAESVPLTEARRSVDQLIFPGSALPTTDLDLGC